MSLNIKDPEVHNLAAELARLRGVSMTKAVHDAVRHELTREMAERGKGGLAAELVEIGKRCAAHLRGPVSSADHAALLYDERGLPRR